MVLLEAVASKLKAAASSRSSKSRRLHFEATNASKKEGDWASHGRRKDRGQLGKALVRAWAPTSKPCALTIS